MLQTVSAAVLEATFSTAIGPCYLTTVALPGHQSVIFLLCVGVGVCGNDNKLVSKYINIRPVCNETLFEDTYILYVAMGENATLQR